jgi:hypothetical protein
MSDALVEKVARAIRVTEITHWGYYVQMYPEAFLPWEELPERKQRELKKEARAAIAVVLEEAAKVAEHYEPRCDVCPRGVADAIRALKDKEKA